MFASVQLWFVIFLLPTISIAYFQPFLGSFVVSVLQV